MEKKSAPWNTKISHAYRMRGELPLHAGTFYRDADKSRSAFETAQAAQIDPATVNTRPVAVAGTYGGDTWMSFRRGNTFGLADPHPSFAVPNRRLGEDSWFHQLETREDGRAMTKQEFLDLRTRKSKSQRKARRRDESYRR